MRWKIIAAACGCLCLTFSAFAQGTAFTYQGRLADTGQATSGLYDFTFSLHSANSPASPQFGSTLTNLATLVTNGYFTTVLDFGAVFNGQPAWLEIGVRTNGAAVFTNLTPLTAITPTPYATYAANAGVASAVAASNISGTISYASLAALPGSGSNTVLYNTGSGLQWGPAPGGNGGTSTVSLSLNGYTNLIGYGDSIMAGLGMGVTISDGFMGIVATNLGVSFADLGVGGQSMYEAGFHFYIPNSWYPNIAPVPGSIYLLEGGVNDAAELPNLDINIFSNIVVAEAAWLSFLPGTDPTARNESSAQRFDAYDLMGPLGVGHSIFGSTSGIVESNHWVGDWNPVEYIYGIGIVSTNAADSVTLTNITGPTFFYWHHISPGFFPGGYIPGTNVVFVNGISNCTVPNYVTNIAANGGAPLYGIGLTVLTGLSKLSNNIITISNLTACASGYSGPSTAMSFVAGGCPGSQTTFNPVYIIGQYIPSNTAYYNPSEILAQNQAKQQISAFLKSVGLPVAFVGITGQVAPLYLSTDGLHPANQGYANMAVSVRQAILNNLAWSGVESPN